MNKNFKVNTDDIDYNGTSLVGYVTTTYDRLVEILGEPETDFEKSTAHWNIKGADGTVATIYDWKLDFTPRGLYEWHIGGRGIEALGLVKSILRIETIPYHIRHNW